LLGTLGAATVGNMAKLKLQATKLESPSVSYISLVERGANRVPFRIIKEHKSENGMIDLDKIFKRDSTPAQEVEKTEPAQAPEPTADSPTIVGLVVEKSDKLPEVIQILKDAGFQVESQEEQEDGTVVFKQAESIEGADVLRLNSNLLALTKNFPKVSVGVVAKAEGFIPGVDMAFGGMFEAVQGLMISEESAEEKVQKLEQMCGDVKSLLSSHLTHIPRQVFIAAEAIDNLPEPVVKAEEEPAKEETKEEPKAEEITTPEATDNTELIQKIAQELLGPVMEKMSSLSSVVDVLGKTVSDIAKKSETLEAKVAEASDKAIAVQNVVKGTVVGAPPKSDPPSRTVKSEDSDPRSGLFDTAFLPRRKLHSR